jgi:hypothetical protein
MVDSYLTGRVENVLGRRQTRCECLAAEQREAPFSGGARSSVATRSRKGNVQAIAPEIVESSGPVPARLCPWMENPYRLVSLWDMLPFLAYDFCRASCVIGQLYAQVKSGVYPTDSSWGMVGGELGMLERACESLGLASALAQIRRIKPIFVDGAQNVVYADLARDIMEVQTRLIDDLHARTFLVLQSEYAGYYQGTSGQFGYAVDGAFPSAAYDISESSKCYALHRSTGCVFHLMRVLEIGLSVFATKFGVPSDHTNWHNIIEGIEKAVRAMASDPNRQPDWKEQQEFYSQAASHFMVLKDAWRNYTAHKRGKYTEEEAQIIFLNVRSFMQKLATRLRE